MSTSQETRRYRPFKGPGSVRRTEECLSNLNIVITETTMSTSILDVPETSLIGEDANMATSKQHDLEVKVSQALVHLPWELDLLLTRRYGLGGISAPRSVEQMAQESRSSVQTVKERENKALRMLMGYGS